MDGHRDAFPKFVLLTRVWCGELGQAERTTGLVTEPGAGEEGSGGAVCIIWK